MSHSEGCACCGQWPVVITQRCHPKAATMTLLNEDGRLAVICAECEADILVTQTHYFQEQAEREGISSRDFH